MSFIIIQEIMALRPPQKTRHDVFHQYSQTIRGVTYNMCWLFAPLVSLSSLFNYKLSEDQVLRFVNACFQEGLENKGYPIDIGAEIAVRKRNEWFPNMKAKRRGAIYGEKHMRPHLRRGNPIVIHIRTGDKYREDRKDGVLENLFYRPKDKISAHAITVMRKKGQYYFAESEPGMKYLVSRQYLDAVRGLIETKRDPNIIYFDKA